MKDLKVLLIGLSGILFTCCTNNLEEDLTQSVLPVTMQEQLQTYPDDFLTHENLSEDEIAFVAKVFAKDNLMPDADSRAVTDKEVEEIFPFLIDGGRILAYAVNYQGGGYSIISATQKYTPIIAYGEEGKISPDWANEESGFTFWMGLMKEDMVCQLNKKDNADSTVININMLWSDYTAKAATITQYAANATLPEKSHSYWYSQERTKMMMASFTDPSHMMSEDLEEYRRALVNYKGGVISDSEMRNFQMQNTQIKLNYEKYGLPRSNVASYFWNEYKKGYNIIDKGPLVQTRWHQDEPYNKFNPKRTDGKEGYQLLGCVTIAVAQILNYYKYPETLKRAPGFLYDVDWSKTTDLSLPFNSPNEDIPRLLRFVNQGVFTDNGNTQSGSNIDKAKDFFDLNGYNTQKLDGLYLNRIEEEIKANRPVYVRGVDNDKNGHAFICCGYRETSLKMYIELKTTSSLDVKTYTTNPYWVSRAAEGSELMKEKEYCFNWGGGAYPTWVKKPLNAEINLNGYNNEVKILIIHKP